MEDFHLRDFRLRMQMDEVLGDVNRYLCASAHRRQIDDPEILWAHFIRNGGAADFARRFREAMGDDNRYYCSRHFGRDVRDPQTLWDYYNQNAGSKQNPSALI